MAESNSVAEELHQKMNVPELRQLASENDVSRERGASKAETALAIADQAPAAAADAVGMELEEPGYDALCTCGLEEEHDELADAVDAAKSHAADCREWMGASGLGGLTVWCQDSGARAWIGGGEGYTNLVPEGERE